MNDKTHEKYFTPTYDGLSAKRKIFVDKYAERDNHIEAAKAANRSDPEVAGKVLLQEPEIQKAINEVKTLNRAKAEKSKATIIRILHAKATVTLEDLTVPDDTCPCGLRLLLPSEIAEEFKCCAGMVKYTKEGDVLFNEAEQGRATDRLAKMMMWDQAKADQVAPLQLNFNGIKQPKVEKKNSK